LKTTVDEAMRQEKKLVSSADFLTASRLPLAVAFLYYQHSGVRFAILGLFVITDVLDGAWARKVGGSRIGGVLDPVCDKFFMLAGFWAVYSAGFLNEWGMLAVLLRDVVALLSLITASVMGRPTALPSRAGGKAVTVVQILTLVAFVAGSDLTVSLAWATGAISLYAIWDYSKVFGATRNISD
jgi:phosphatidylglycerophosphate synthase